MTTAATKKTTRRAPRRKAPVETRQLEGAQGWTKEDAAFLVYQGYSVEHAAKVTGFPTALITMQFRVGAHRKLATLTEQSAQ